MYQLPLLAAVAPDRAWNHVRYRINRLPAARTLAAQDGYSGARYPFTSFGDGLEDPPRSGGLTGQQVHINADMAWGILHTYRLTGDDALLLDGALEVLLELSRFWLSFVSGPDASGRRHIRNICGPDELHAGVDDNTYTNALVASTLTETADLVEALEPRYPAPIAALTRRLAYDATARGRVRRIAAGLHRPRLSNGAPAAFERYEAEREPNLTVRNHGRAALTVLAKGREEIVPGGDATAGQEPHVDALAALPLARLRQVFATVENPLDPYFELNVAKMKTELAAG